MKLKSIILATACSALLISAGSCTDAGSKSAKAFAERFAGYIHENQKDSIIAVYPAIEYADEYELTYQPDSLKIIKTDTEGEYEIYYGRGVYILAKIGKEGDFSVIKSGGLFKYPESKLEFAKKTGALKDDQDDEQLAKTMIRVNNMATDLFNDYVDRRKNAIKNLGFTATKELDYGMSQGEGYYTIRNTTDEPIGGDEYDLVYKNWSFHIGMEKEEVFTQIEPGKDIEPRGTVRLPEIYTWHFGRELQAIKMHTPSQESFFKHYHPTGEEFANYIRIHGNEEINKEALSYGPFSFAGKLDGKYAVHINLVKGMKSGTYYYDKYGPNATIDLVVKSFNDRTGELTMEEINDKGEMTGTFTGVISSDGYKGKMNTFQGKTYNFDLKTVE